MWDGADYQRRIDEMAQEGRHLHAEADVVQGRRPETVLDAGCGTGRVAIELARRGIAVTGVDRDPSMLAVARERGSGIEWIQGDLAKLDLGRTFSVVLLAGNVPLFADAGTADEVVKHAAHHVGRPGALIAGFRLGEDYSLESYDACCAEEGLEIESRWSTWEGGPFDLDADYAVSIHVRLG